MASSEFNERIIEEFRANEGRVGGTFEGNTLLLLHHTGARSGRSRINPLAYQGDNGRYVVFASKAGAPTNPDWYHNLKAHPDVTIEVGTATIDVARQRGDRRGARAPVPHAGRAHAPVRRVRETDRARDSGDHPDAHRSGLSPASERVLARSSERRARACAVRAARRGPAAAGR